MSNPTTAIIVKGYPRLSETFIAQELAALEQKGLTFNIYSLRKPHDTIKHPIHKKISAKCHYLPEYIYQQPIRAIKSIAKQITNKGFYKSLPTWINDLRKDPTPNRMRRIIQAIILASELPESIQYLYFHFIHTPASVTRYTAKLRNLPYSGSAHAKDIWTSPTWELKDKLKDAEWCATCTKAGHQYLQSIEPTATTHLVYHGLDPADFPPKPKNKTLPTPKEQINIISVGRLVGKKGYHHVLRSLALLAEQNWHFTHIGGGDNTPYQQLANDLNIAGKVTFLGAQVREDVVKLLSSADIFVLGNIIMSDGDRDGIPNVLMEALWMGVPVMAGESASVQELIQDEKNGLLWDARDEIGFAKKLEKLIISDELRQKLSTAGRQRMQEKFLFSHNFKNLCDLFPQKLFSEKL